MIIGIVIYLVIGLLFGLSVYTRQKTGLDTNYSPYAVLKTIFLWFPYIIVDIYNYFDSFKR
jgi:ABC-type methionine transport system permease subunit